MTNCPGRTLTEPLILGTQNHSKQWFWVKMYKTDQNVHFCCFCHFSPFLSFPNIHSGGIILDLFLDHFGHQNDLQIALYFRPYFTPYSRHFGLFYSLKIHLILGSILGPFSGLILGPKSLNFSVQNHSKSMIFLVADVKNPKCLRSAF